MRPRELVTTVEFPSDLHTDGFYLSDFGLSKKIDDTTTQHGWTPKYYCSPERFHKYNPSFACDIWSYMVIFSELYLTITPFPRWFLGGLVTAMVECLGPLPERWKGLYNHPEGLDSWYDQSQIADPKGGFAAQIARLRPDADAAEQELVRTIMLKVFIYAPEKRLSAKELLQDPDFRALMDRYGC
ncbi:hypothetical protein N7478_002927 [Penicillium angulare]|uniref:uncharacterized protein n=1 Tax=Penicillium angulare TaxID=116970 RepID=UPI002541537C|nr:uncharacterized protein N7478_002927 [Penicillium angulare]KAJ5287241.1 hypothetical protein N7478_002927 [Penicillium angulare]